MAYLITVALIIVVAVELNVLAYRKQQKKEGMGRNGDTEKR